MPVETREELDFPPHQFTSSSNPDIKVAAGSQIGVGFYTITCPAERIVFPSARKVA